MPRAKKVTQEQALAALTTLMQFGRQSFHKEAKVGFGQCVGKAMGALMSTQQIAQAAAEAFEDHNAHDMAATIRGQAVGV